MMKKLIMVAISVAAIATLASMAPDLKRYQDHEHVIGLSRVTLD